jgi:hypothetical protein
MLAERFRVRHINTIIQQFLVNSSQFNAAELRSGDLLRCNFGLAFWHELMSETFYFMYNDAHLTYFSSIDHRGAPPDRVYLRSRSKEPCKSILRASGKGY